ncbi:MAG: ATP-dependent helicase, partial [Rothia dentocariosa]
MPAQGAGASKQQALFGIPAQKSSPTRSQTPQVPARPVPSPVAPQQNHATPQLSPEDILAGLDEDQRRVASELNGAMRVLAGAGTGKTRAITHRIAYGIACGKYVPQRVMALTFTTRAAEEMRLRLRSLGAVGVQTRTFHSAALRQLRYFWPSAIGGSFPDIVKHKAGLITEAAQRLRMSVDRALVRDIAAEIEWAKVSLFTPDTLTPHLHQRNLPSGITPQNMVRLFRAYEDLKDERNLIDFEDVLLLTVGIIEDDDALAATIREQYRYFVVDEYQDVSPLQQRLLDAWLGERDDLCVVGDASQTIYSFTGATSRHLLEFPRRYRGAHTVRLTRDYRSHSQVVELANRLLAARRPRPDSTEFSWAPPLKLVSQRGPGVESQWFGYTDDEREAEGIAEDIQDLLDKDGVPPSEIAVLFRTNGQSGLLEAALADRGIPYQLRGAEQFFDRPEIKQAMLALRASAKS